MWDLLQREIITGVRAIELPALALFGAFVWWLFNNGTTSWEDPEDIESDGDEGVRPYHDGGEDGA